MRTKIQKILNLNMFFKILNCNEKTFTYTLEKPSTILIQNIQSNWLNSILSKTQKNLPVFLNEKHIDNKKPKIPFGFINQTKIKNNESEIFKHNVEECGPKEKTELIFNMVVPKQDTMQYFIQWQRYRKYWWSSITTTPSLFSIGDIKNGDLTADVNIVAKFPWGDEVVEMLNSKPAENIGNDFSHLSCMFSAENALFILLLDGLTNSTREGYLRLHRTMAPYKFSFALDEASKHKETLKELADLLHSRLSTNKISSWLPDFSLPMEPQIKENLQMGVAYTAILSEDTLKNGIFHLLNSSTMLKEQLHVVDFDTYAALICRR